MTALWVVAGSLAGLFYCCMVMIVRAMTAKMRAKNHAFGAYMRSIGTEKASPGDGDALAESESEADLEARLSDAMQWPSWRFEFQRSLRAELNPYRGFVFGSALVIAVVAAIVLALLAIEDDTSGWGPSIAWPVVLCFIGPWFVATGAADMADRFWRRGRADSRRSRR